MSMLPRVVLLALMATQAPLAADTAPAVAGPTEASVKELMTITDARKLLDGVPTQVDAAMQASLQALLGDERITPAQQQILDDMRAKTAALFKAQMSWDLLEPLFMEAYSKNFTQSELDGMIAFYRSAPGQAMIAKMPLVMQHTMQSIQGQIKAMRPKLEQYQQDAATQLAALQKE